MAIVRCGRGYPPASRLHNTPSERIKNIILCASPESPAKPGTRQQEIIDASATRFVANQEHGADQRGGVEAADIGKRRTGRKAKMAAVVTTKAAAIIWSLAYAAPFFLNQSSIMAQPSLAASAR
jgi:hypothetical protein